jgi:hypothetical protein
MSNWKTTLSGVGAAFVAMLAAFAALPYQLGDVATLIAPEWKARISVAGFIAAFVLRVIQSITAADANPQSPATSVMLTMPVVQAPPAPATIEPSAPAVSPPTPQAPKTL